MESGQRLLLRLLLFLIGTRNAEGCLQWIYT